MAENAYEFALARREQILVELAELKFKMNSLNAELAAANEVIHAVEKWNSVVAGEALPIAEWVAPSVSSPSEIIGATEPVVGGSVDAPKPRGRERNPLSPREIANVVREILLERGEPLTRSQLVMAFESRGVPLAGKDKSKNVGTILWRYGDEFINLPGHGYWLKDVPNEEIGYNP